VDWAAREVLAAREVWVEATEVRAVRSAQTVSPAAAQAARLETTGSVDKGVANEAAKACRVAARPAVL
jgi:hypothetical protein